MESRTKASVIAITLFAALAFVGRLAVQAQTTTQDLPALHHHYKLIDLGTLGGPQSYVNAPNNYAPVLNNRGMVAGWADTSTPDPFPAFCFNEEDPCFLSHTFQWQNGVTSDLGALPGGGSSASNWISANGLIAGVSQNGETDPSFPGFPEFRAVLWKQGKITDLGTLEGGNESISNAVNSQGKVVGLATNAVPDDFSLFGTTEAHAFLWQNGVMQDLGTLGGTDSVALLVNEKGQVVGESYTGSAPSTYNGCTLLGFPLTTGAFLWENGTMINLGSFGGTCTFATDLNNQGQIVGISALPGDEFQHAFLWNRGSLNDLSNTIGGNNAAAIALNDGGDVVGWASLQGDQNIHASLWKNNTMTDLGTVGGDACSVGFSVNATGQVVGISVAAALPIGCDFSQTRASLWEDGGPMVDLNALIAPDATLFLTSPETINDRGEIAGVGLDSDGNQHAFLLIPCSADDRECQEAHAGPAFRPAPATPKPANNQNNAIRRMLSHRSGPLYKVGVSSTSSEPSASGGASSAPAAQGSTATTAGLTITSGAPPNGTVGVSYGGFHTIILDRPRPASFSFTGWELTATGGLGSYRWSWSAAPGSTLPAGLSVEVLRVVSGGSTRCCEIAYIPVIGGRPSVPGTYHVIVTVTDSSSPPNHASATYSITIFQ